MRFYLFWSSSHCINLPETKAIWTENITGLLNINNPSFHSVLSEPTNTICKDLYRMAKMKNVFIHFCPIVPPFNTSTRHSYHFFLFSRSGERAYIATIAMLLIENYCTIGTVGKPSETDSIQSKISSKTSRGKKTAQKTPSKTSSATAR